MTQPSRIFDLLAHFDAENPGKNIFNFNVNNEWVGISTPSFIRRVNDLSKGLLAMGVKPGDKVGLISENRVEWNIIDFAVQQTGAAIVAIYPNISDNDYRFILNDAEINICFVSNDNLFQRLLNLKDEIPTVEHVYTLDEYPTLPFWEKISVMGFDQSNDELDRIKANIQPTDLATLIYTSGTTGTPKGVMLSHENILADVYSSEYSFPVQQHDTALTFLPTCHAYERIFQYVYMKIGISIFYARSLDTIGDDIKSVKPNIFSAVPRVLEKVYEKNVATGEQLSGIKRKLFFWALDLGERYDLDETKLSWWYKFQLKIARKLIFSKWKQALGGNIKGIASGSATLQTKLLRIYLAAGIPIYEGYGLTEAGPCLSVNCLKRGMKVGTVGIPLVGIEVKLAPDGEVIARGKNIMQGYYKNPEATAEVLKDGWLYTGDIGEFDGEFLKIIDRKKEMFKTSGGKYIVPQQMEAKFSESNLIEQIMVVGEGKKFAAALIVPAYEKLNEWLKATGDTIANLNPDELIKNSKVKAKIADEIQRINENFGSWEKIKDFKLLPHVFAIETGELTPTLKIKRKVIEQKYQQLIEEIYYKKAQVGH